MRKLCYYVIVVMQVIIWNALIHHISKYRKAQGFSQLSQCFGSDAFGDDVDIMQLIAELNDFPVPTTRLHVRCKVIPRVTCVRQSKHIRTTILNRRQVNMIQRSIEFLLSFM